ncbi:MAG: hydrogenase iron-sulfur subunit [Thermoplasmata archaeon]
MDNQEFKPKILVFSTNKISDPGIDLAGLLKMHYPSTVYVIPVPCSSMIKPKWILHALKSGFDGVFVAADGTDCPYLPTCTEKTATNVSDAQKLIEENGGSTARVRMAAICSVCAEPFVNHMKNFYNILLSMEPAEVELNKKKGA